MVSRCLRFGFLILLWVDEDDAAEEEEEEEGAAGATAPWQR